MNHAKERKKNQETNDGSQITTSKTSKTPFFLLSCWMPLGTYHSLAKKKKQTHTFFSRLKPSSLFVYFSLPFPRYPPFLLLKQNESQPNCQTPLPFSTPSIAFPFTSKEWLCSLFLLSSNNRDLAFLPSFQLQSSSSCHFPLPLLYARETNSNTC